MCSYILEKLPQAAKHSIYSLVFVWTKLHSSIRSFQRSLSLICAVFHLIIYLDDMSVGKSVCLRVSLANGDKTPLPYEEKHAFGASL